MRRINTSSAARKRDIHFLDDTVAKTKEWLKEIQAELGLESDKDAYAALRSVIQVLRDRLSVEEAVELGAQLPMLIRGFYYEGWTPKGKPEKIRDVPEFLDRVTEKLKGRFSDGPDVHVITEGVIKILQNKISQGEIENIKAILPADLLTLWPSQGFSQAKATEKPRQTDAEAPDIL